MPLEFTFVIKRQYYKRLQSNFERFTLLNAVYTKKEILLTIYERVWIHLKNVFETLYNKRS